MSDFYAFDLSLAATALEERAARLRSDAKRTSAAGAAVLEREAQTTFSVATTFHRAAREKREAQREADKNAAAKRVPPIPGGPLAA